MLRKLYNSCSINSKKGNTVTYSQTQKINLLKMLESSNIWECQIPVTLRMKLTADSVEGISGTIQLNLLCSCLINKNVKIQEQTYNFALNLPLCAHAHVCMREKLGLTYTQGRT